MRQLKQLCKWGSELAVALFNFLVPEPTVSEIKREMEVNLSFHININKMGERRFIELPQKTADARYAHEKL